MYLDFKFRCVRESKIENIITLKLPKLVDYSERRKKNKQTIQSKNYTQNDVFYSKKLNKGTRRVVVSEVNQKRICKCTRELNAGISLISICILVTPNIILPITACFQSLRSCSFGECFLTGNCNYKDL